MADGTGGAGATLDGSETGAGEAFLAALAARGIDYLFGNAGTDFPPVIEGYARLARSSVPVPQPVTVPHENLAVAMAHGAFLATGKPQAVMLHVNVGTANAVCGLLNAQRENVPLLLMAGRTPWSEGDAFGSRSVFIHWGQEMFDQAGLVREAVKWDYELRRPDQVADAVDRALAIAQAAPQGPVYLSLPREVLASPSGPADMADGQRLAVPWPVAPAAEAVRTAADLLAAAERPLVICGSFGRDPGGVAALAALAEDHALPVTGYRPRYLFLPHDHPMHLGFEPAALLKDADVVLVLDCDVPWIPKLHDVNPAAKIIHAGADPLYSAYPMRSFRADLNLQGDSTLILRALSAGMEAAVMDGGGPGKAESRRRWIATERAAYDDRVRKLGAGLRGEGVSTNGWVAKCLAAEMTPEDVLLVETMLPLPLLPLTRPGSYFGTTSAGGLGWGLGAALGLKLGQRERRVIGVVGDGAYMFGNPTPAHYVAQALDLPTLTIILNNRMWAAVRRATLGLYPDGAASESNESALTYLEPAPAYEKVVEASGGYGEVVETAAELPAALARALAEVDGGRQAVLNVITEYSDAAAVADSKK